MIRLYDTLAREKREFVPADPSAITMYVCGPTVYGRAHIGNARPAVVFDTLRRLIAHQYGQDSLTYARNITDVDDKIIAAAEAEGVEPSVITERFERFYLEDMGVLGVRPPDIAPHATAEIPAMIAMIEALVARNHAYAAEGMCCSRWGSDPEYGQLSRRDREAMIAGARVEVAPYKRDPADFVLWKPSADDVIGWDSPWGRGRPGWHIECSAMIRAHLGETIDIHGGGLDLIFPHHENEIAQSRCAHGGAPLARYWVHNGFVDMGAEKMSKSLGNIVTVDRLLDAGHRGEVLRMALLSGHYRSPLPWTESLIAQSKATLDGLYRKAGDAADGAVDAGVVEALDDDLNTPLAISRLGQIENPASLRASCEFLGLLTVSEAQWFQGAGDLSGIEQRIAARAKAKESKDFVESDRIRDELTAEGILLEDGPGDDVAAGLSQPLYTRDILRLAASIPGQRSFAELGEAAVVRSSTCGSRVAMRVTLDDHGQVTAIEQAVEACAFGQAAAALVGMHAIGTSHSDAAAALADVERWLDGEGDEPWPDLLLLDAARARRGRHGAILLPFRALVQTVGGAK